MGMVVLLLCFIYLHFEIYFFWLLNSGMSAAWYPATTWTLGIYSTLGDALLSEVLNVQSELSDGIVKFLF